MKLPLPESDKLIMERALKLTTGFAAWPASDMDRLLSSSVLQRYRRADAVSDEQEALEMLAVVSGYVGVFRAAEDGTRAILEILGPGRVVGLARHLDNDWDDPFSFAALDDAIVIHTPVARLMEVLEKDPALYRDMLIMTLRQNRQSTKSAMKHHFGSLRSRLAATVQRFVVLYGVVDAGGKGQIRLRLKQTELADLLRVTRQSVNQEFRVLSDLGIISLRNGAIVLLDAAKLREISNDVRAAGWHPSVDEGPAR